MPKIFNIVFILVLVLLLLVLGVMNFQDTSNVFPAWIMTYRLEFVIVIFLVIIGLILDMR